MYDEYQGGYKCIKGIDSIWIDYAINWRKCAVIGTSDFYKNKRRQTCALITEKDEISYLEKFKEDRWGASFQLLVIPK